MLGLSDFFEILVLASECDRVKPFPDPYLKALQELDISHKHAFVFEVCLFTCNLYFLFILKVFLKKIEFF